MIMLLQRFGIALAVILATGILLAEESEFHDMDHYEPTEFDQRLSVGLISTDPAQWNDETRKEFFGNMPTEYHQKYLDAYATLREANNEFWQTRAELFVIVHSCYKKEIEETYNEEFLKKLEDQFKENEESFNERMETHKEAWEQLKKSEEDHKRDWEHVQTEKENFKEEWGEEEWEEIVQSYKYLREQITKEQESLKENWIFTKRQWQYDQRDYNQQMGIRNGDYSIIAKDCSAENFVFYLSETWKQFRQYPDLFDPKKQTEYWNSLTEEILFVYGYTTEALRRQAEKQRKETVELREWLAQRTDKTSLDDVPEEELSERLRWRWDEWEFSDCIMEGCLPLTDEQKLQIIGDEPFTHLATLSSSIEEWQRKHWHDWWYQHWRFDDGFPLYPASAILMEARDAEREPWKIEATPELTKLAIDQEEVDRWDGSLSLHPFIRNIAERCEEIDTARLQTNIYYASKEAAEGKTLSNTHPALMALIRGEKEVVFSARRLSQTEIEETEKLGVELVFVPFAKDAFVFLQNRQNPVRNLTVEQYQGIFSGTHPSWADVGGFGGTIEPFIRNVNSGSEELMQTLVMKDIAVHKDFQPKSLSGMSFVFEALENTPGGIAYSIYHYDRYMVFNPNTRVMAVNGVLPSAETIASGEYPLVYECVLVHRKNPGEKVERFVQWLLSEEGQKLVRSVGYVPMDKLQ